MPASCRREIAIRIILPVASILVFLLLAELLLQLVSPVLKPRFTRVDPAVGWSHNPSVASRLRTESHEYELSYGPRGHRPPVHPVAKPPGALRVAFLGDSFTDGAEVGDTETFCWRLEQYLGDIEVVNLGVYAYTTAQEAITLEREALRYDPDLVILLTMTNDFDANMLTIGDFGPSPRFVLAGDSLSREGTDAPDTRWLFRRTNLPLPGMTWLHRHSHVYYLLNHYIYQRLIAERIARLMEEQKGSLAFADQVELYRRLVHRMRGRSVAAGADFWVAFGYLREDLFAASLPARSVPEQLAADGIRTLDLYDFLRDLEAERAGAGSLYYDRNIHWNPAGHEAVASFFAPVIREWAAARGR